MLRNLITTILISVISGTSNLALAEQKTWLINEDNYTNRTVGQNSNNYMSKCTYSYENTTNTTVSIEGYRYNVVKSNSYNSIDYAESIQLTFLKLTSNVDVELTEIDLYYNNNTVHSLNTYTYNVNVSLLNSNFDYDSFMQMPYFTYTNLLNKFTESVNYRVDNGAYDDESYTGTNIGNGTNMYFNFDGYYTSQVRYICIKETTTITTTDYVSPQNFNVQLLNYGLANINTIKVKYIEPATTINPDVEVIDIGGLLWQILSMPFAFISQAFNLTLFAGTNFAVNIGALFLGILGVLMMIALITILLKVIK